MTGQKIVKAVGEWAVSTVTHAAEQVSGDAYVIAASDERLIAAAIDGAGHGPKAREAARAAVEALRSCLDGSAGDLMRRCHRELTATRGAAMNLAIFNRAASTMAWVGVGNISGIFLRQNPAGGPHRSDILLLGGALGHSLPALQEVIVPVSSGDTLIFATDGIDPKFASAINLADPPQAIADGICSGYAKGNDDGLVLVVKYLGAGE